MGAHKAECYHGPRADVNRRADLGQEHDPDATGPVQFE